MGSISDNTEYDILNVKIAYFLFRVNDKIK